MKYKHYLLLFETDELISMTLPKGSEITLAEMKRRYPSLIAIIPDKVIFNDVTLLK